MWQDNADWVKVLSGTLPDLEQLPAPRSKVIRIYLCSNGTDTVEERAALAQRVYPQLREYCRRKYGLEFQMVDPWLGQTQPHIGDDRDRHIRMREIQQCQELSVGPNFVALIGQRYGQRPLPAVIAADHFDSIREALLQHRSRDTRDAPLLEQWYRRDDNTCPPIYRLLRREQVVAEPPSDIMKMIKGIPEEALPWPEAEVALRRLLRRGLDYCMVESSVDEMEARSYFTSDFEKEIERGILHSVDPHNSCLVFIRDIVDLKNYTNYPQASSFLDVMCDAEDKDRVVVDEDSESLLTALRDQKLNRCLPAENTHTFQVLWKHNQGISATHHQQYISDFCDTFHTKMVDMVDRTAHTQAVTSPLLVEVTEHWQLAKVRCQTFVGADDLLDIIRSYVLSNEEKPLVLHGESGIGKTATIAKAASQVNEWLASDTICVLRFLGCTAASHDIRQILHNVCLQINTALGWPAHEVPNDYKDLQQYFLDMLGSFPENRNMVVFLDGLNMLAPQYNAHHLGWLPNALRENVKIVLSTQPHQILDKLKSDVISNENNFVEMQPLSAEECMHLMNTLLLGEGRTLGEEQKDVVLQALGECSLPICAYLLLGEARHWKSWDMVEALPHTAKEHMEAIFNTQEAKHGKVLVTRALAYLTASSTGLSDCEIEDILSLDDTVLNAIYGRAEPAVPRLPPFAWIRLKYDLRDYLLTKETEGVTVSFWNHWILTEAAKNCYLGDENQRKDVHSALADYNLGVWHATKKAYWRPTSANSNEVEYAADRLVPGQPLVFQASGTNTHYNKRKYDQVPRHLFLANRLAELNEEVLFSYEWLYNKTKALSLEHVLMDFVLNPGVEATLVERALRDAHPFISASVNSMAPEISGRLLVYYNSHPDIRKLINECDTAGLKHCALLPNFPYHQVPGSPLRYTFQCSGTPTSFGLCGHLLLCKESSSPAVEILDLATGETRPNVVTSVGEMHVTPDGQRLVVVERVTEQAIKVHTSDTGNFCGQLIPMNQIEMKPKEKYKLGKVCVSDTNICLVVTTDKSYLCVADIDTCRFTDIRGLSARASICEITPDSRYVFTNSATTLLAYDLLTMDEVNTTKLEYKPKQVIFNSDVSKGFLINGEENKIYVLIIREGRVEFMYKVVASEAFQNDQIQHLTISNNQEMVLVRGGQNILVYHVGTEKVVCQIVRPPDVPLEFKLPRSEYTDIEFTQVEFSPDDKFVIGTIFRNVYIWQVSNNRLMTSLQAPVGIINGLFVPSGRGQVVTHLDKTGVVHVWSLGDAIGHAGMPDRLTSAVAEAQLTQDDTIAFVRCQDSDEIGVLNMHSGQLIDLLTHENPVSSISITSNGDYAFVTVKQAKRNLANKIWYISGRKIIYEFGSTAAYSVPLQHESSIISICQETSEFNAPYWVSVFTMSADSFEEYKYGQCANFILSQPFVTPEDRYLVLLSADAYDHQNAFHVNPTIFSVSLKSGTAVKTYSAEDLQDRVRIRRMLHIRSYANNPYTVIVFYTNEPDLRDIRQSARGYDHCYGFMIFDVCSGVVCQVIEEFLAPSTPMDQVLFTSDASLCLDNQSNIFDIGTGYFVKQLSDKPVKPRRLALDGKVALYFLGSSLYVIRMSDGVCVGDVSAHGAITVVEVCKDERTILVGCKDGALMSYVLLDESMDDPENVLPTVASRKVQLQLTQSYGKDNMMLRSWDRVNGACNGPPYSRSPSALLNGPTDRQMLKEVQHISRTSSSRPKSDTVLYTGRTTSMACIVM